MNLARHDTGKPVDWRRVERVEWLQPARMARRWELHVDGERVIDYHAKGPFSAGRAESSIGSVWKVTSSIWHRHSVTREDASAPAVQSGRLGFRNIQIRREAGEPLIWRIHGFFTPEYWIENDEKFPFVRFERRRSFLKHEAVVHLEDAGRELPDLEPLLLLGWVMSLTASRRRSS